MTDAFALILAWEALAAAGVCVQTFLLWRTRVGLTVMQAEGRNGPARLVSWQDIRTDATFLSIMAILVILGPFFHFEIMPRIVVAGLFCVITLALYSALMKVHDRNELHDVLRSYALKNGGSH